MGGVSCPKSTYKKPKPEKVQKIKLQTENECWICGTVYNLEAHHIFSGTNRSKSEKYGLKVWLCHNHHNESIPDDKGVHFNRYLDLRLKRFAQREFEKVYGHDKWMAEFYKNYL